MTATLLVPLDGSPLADAAVPHAVEIARRTGAKIVLCRVHTPGAMVVSPPDAPLFMPDPMIEERMRTASHDWIWRRAVEVRAECDVAVDADFRIGAPVDQIVAAAAEWRAMAIVCGTHGWSGAAPHWLGSVADALVRHAPCPVLAMTDSATAAPAAIRTLLVPIDGSEVSLAILPHAVWLARAFDAEIELLQIVAPYWVDDSLEPAAAGRQDPFGVDGYTAATKDALDTLAGTLRAQGVRTKTAVDIHSSAGRAILTHVARTKPDAIAMSTYGRGFSRLLLGSVADKVLRASGLPVLLFRPGTRAVAEAAAAGLSVSVAEPVPPRTINRAVRPA